MSTLQVQENISAKMEQVLINGDLKSLSPEECIQYYNAVCKSTGLNPLTRPLEYMILNGKKVLYARRDCADQLRKIHGVSIDDVKTLHLGDLYIVTVTASIGDRKDSATGALNVKGLAGEALANALMKAETKAKRRVTLSICGLGLLDETEVGDATETIVQEKVVESRKRFEEPAPAPVESKTLPASTGGDRFLAVKISFDDVETRKALKAKGFQWDAAKKVWAFPETDEMHAELKDMGFEFEVVSK